MTCPHGDRFCPCPDGALCHYEGHMPWPSPNGLTTAAVYREQVAAALLAICGEHLPTRMKPDFEERLDAARLARVPAADHARAFIAYFNLQPLPSSKAA